MEKWIILVFALIVFGLVGCKNSKKGREKGQEAKRLIEQNGAILLDVRTKNEFDAGHIDKALHIPVSELSDNLAKLPDKKKTIVVYCRSGRRSATAARFLQSKGYNHVFDMGGMGNWPKK